MLDFVTTGKFNFKDLANSIISDIARIAIKKAIIAPIVGGITSLFGEGTSIFGGGGASSVPTLSGARALGGPVTGGDSFLVGERGPEIFTPNNSGRIIPNNKLNQGGSGGGGNSMSKSDVSITINAIDTQTGVAFLLSQKDTISAIFNSSLTSNGSIRANL